MTGRFFRNKESGVVYPEFLRGSSQTNFPKDWEEVFPDAEVEVEVEVEVEEKPVVKKEAVKSKPKGK